MHGKQSESSDTGVLCLRAFLKSSKVRGIIPFQP
jgi:hypothetical protein